MRVEEFEKQLFEGKLNSLYLLYGEETFLLENSLKKLKKIFGEILQGINYVYIDDTNIDNIISDLETPAFGFEKKLIVAKNTGLLKKNKKKKNVINENNIMQNLVEYLNKNFNFIKNNVVVVFIETEVDKNDLYNFIEKNGIICNFELQKSSQIQNRLKIIANAYKVNVDNFVIAYLIECVGINMQDLVNEIRKLIEFAGPGGTIMKEDIDILTIKKVESVIFDLTDSFGKKNTSQAIEVLRNLILSKEPIQKILISLYNHFKKLYLVKMAIKENRNIVEALNLKSNQSFLVNKYKSQASFFKMSEIRKILQELCDLDYKYKIGLIDLNIGLEAILCAYS